MSYVVDHWAFDPFLVIALVTVGLHELGLHRLARRSDPRRTAQRRRRAWWFYVGLVVVLLAVESPLDYWADDYFYVHMVQHIFLMFFAPMAVVAGAPWLGLMHALPVRWRRRLGRALILGRHAAPFRALWRMVTAPWSALIAFNVVMVLWHMPAPFDLAERTGYVHIWLMHGSFFVAGLLFWLQILPSWPFHRRASSLFQMGMILTTSVVMFFLAMALSIFTTTSWYSVYAHIPGVRLNPFFDQQIGAGVLWICGDFWAMPALGSVTRRAMNEHGGSLSGLVDAALRGRRDRAIGRFGNENVIGGAKARSNS